MYDETPTTATPAAASPLPYARPIGSTAPPPPHPLPVVLSCLPGLICWLAFLSIYFRIHGQTIWFPLFDSGIGILFLLGCWLVAVITAITSLVRYIPHRPKPWYVVLNLIINTTGLLFTVGLFFLMLVVVVH